MCMLPSRPLEAPKTSPMKAPFSSDDASSDPRGILTRFAHLLVFMPRGSARGDLNLTTNIHGLRHASSGSDRPSSARENQEQRSEAEWKVRSPVKTCTLARPEAPIRKPRHTAEATLKQPQEGTVFASERVPRRRGQSVPSSACDLR